MRRHRPVTMQPPTSTLRDTMRAISALLQAGELRTAHAQLEAVAAAQPDFVEGLRLLGATKQALGDPAGAEDVLRRALALDANWAPTSTTLGELLLSLGRSAEAEPLLQRAARRDPRAALVLARHYNDQRRPAEALDIVAPFCMSGRADAELVTQHVAALAALGRVGDAIAGYQRVAAAAPGNAAAAHALAIALDAGNRPADAEQAARSALACGPRSAALLYTHARSLIALGEFERAESALRDCVRQEPHHIDAHSSLARLVWMRSGDAAQATAALDQALRIFADDDALLAAKAAVLQGAGDARAAYECLEGKAAQPHAAPALLVRAGLAALELDSAAALALAERAHRANPGDATARNLLVAVQLGTGDARSALRHCEALLAGAPDDQYLIALQTTAWRLLGDERYAEFCDYATLVAPSRLEAPPGWRDLAHFLADVKCSLDRLHEPLGHPLLFQSLRHGTETTGDLAHSTDPVIQALFRAFDAPIREYLARIGEGPDPLRRRNRHAYRFNGGWSVRLRNAGYHNSHVHPRGWISSACYIDLPDGMGEDKPDGCLTFGVPSLRTTPALAIERTLRPEAGMLVLFPSYFWHGTVPFASARTRLTVAFDVVPVM
ncbi:MAG TPA: putative 2OG-Fe(II) oxygenase [Rudaea sp.]|nr:putative 2OG-Fe(II) oxygenase [Rudaea sp.]